MTGTMQALTKLAFEAEKLSGRDTFATIYRHNQFDPARMNTQDDSLLLGLPVEICLSIYNFLFLLQGTRTGNPLALLSTCCQIHGEAIEFALRRMQFYINPKIGLAFQFRLPSLGPLQTHLRYIKVEMVIDDLTFSSAANPFKLIELPLDKLEIKLEMPAFLSWMVATRIYHCLVSAILYKDACVSALETTKRRANMTCRQDWATRKQLYSMLASMRTKTVVVKCKDGGEDVYWSAIYHFKLVDLPLVMLRCDKNDNRRDDTDQRRYMLFATGDGKHLLELGQYKRGNRPMVAEEDVET